MDIYIFGCLCIGGLLVLLILGSSIPHWARGLAIVSVVLATTAAVTSGNLRYLDDRPWYQTAPWKEGLLFVSMILGMCTRSLADLIEERRTERKQRPTRKAKLRFDAWEFVYPFLFSAITFGVVLSATEQTPLGFASGLLSFQNGFFWKTMLARQIAIVGEEKSES